MNCDEIQESLSLYCDDGLADDERTRCDRHLEVCPVCRDELAQIRGWNRRMRYEHKRSTGNQRDRRQIFGRII